ncbi:hypothetical protein BJ982_000305 [Sphaerisporangium siamense]|uniref:Uncharacterized protein n=1 Tax=Sphaerisporangium siamense TaxID=795645 RepID=A0A7W7D266_9ACTN|nr:hypothetical protein [Sphaerisporangium siamense]
MSDRRSLLIAVDLEGDGAHPAAGDHPRPRRRPRPLNPCG